MIPEKTFMPGWPEHLVDNDDNLYVRLRDGKPASEFAGESCLYALVGEHGCIDKSNQWVPVLGATEDDMRLTGGTWMTAEQLEAQGQTPIVLPHEPVEWPL
jgi:hypothetical protein